MKTLAEKIAVMQAALDGKQIQYKRLRDDDFAFGDVKCPNWDWQAFDYRVKPAEPKKLVVVYYPDGRSFGTYVMVPGSSQQAHVDGLLTNKGFYAEEYIQVLPKE